jgi:hypothetical protein
MKHTVLAAVIVALGVLYGCEDVEEVELENQGQEHELSAEEILQRVDEVNAEPTSFRSLSKTEIIQSGESPIIVRHEHISVGENAYNREISREPPDGQADPFGPESLYYGGEFYLRGQSGEWIPFEDLIRSHFQIDAGSSGLTGSTGVQLLAEPLFSPTSPSDADAKRLPDDSIDGRTYMRVSVMRSEPFEGPPDDFIGPIPEPERQEWLSTIPDERTYTEVLWIDSDFQVYRREVSGEDRRNGRVISTFHTTFSEFGTAELPGPLPDA